MALSPRRLIDLGGDPGVAQLVIAVVFGVLSITAVALRIVSRRLSRKQLEISDYAIFVALVRSVGLDQYVIANRPKGGLVDTNRSNGH